MDKFEKGLKIAGLGIRFFFGIAVIGTVLYFGNELMSKFGDDNIVTHLASDVTQISQNVEEVEEHDAVITQENVPYPVYVDYGEVILGTASQECNLIIMTRPVQVTDNISKDGLFGLREVFGQTQMVVYHGEAEYSVDLSELNQEDYVINEREHTIRITVPYPTFRVIPNVEDYEFSDPSNGVLRFGALQLTPEAQAELEANAISKMYESVDADAETWTIAEDYARLSIENLFQTSIDAQTNINLRNADDNAQFVYYDVIVDFE